MRIHPTLLILFVLNFAVTSCSSSHDLASLESWRGKYTYQEEPIKAIADYSMVMEWKLDIEKEGEKYIGNLEINGQQTYFKLKSELIGDSNSISLVYLEALEGSSEILKPKDTLFVLNRKGNELMTEWKALGPRLSEDPPKQCNCFRK